MIYCDGGLRHREALGAPPDLVVGDFDSAEDPRLPVETIALPREKDDTDTFYAAREALRRGFREALLLGAAGQRLDHTLGNVGVLLFLQEHGVHAVLADDYGEMEIAGSREVAVSDRYPYFSLIAVDGPARGVCVRDAKYPLENASLSADTSLGVSNEPLPGRSAKITVAEGRLLLLRILEG